MNIFRIKSWLLIAVCVAATLACTQVSPIETEPANPVPIVRSTGTEHGASAPTDAAQRNQTNLAVPTPTPVVHYSQSPYSFVEAPLNGRIYHADVIALVSLREAVGQSETIHSDAGVAPTYRPALMFRFDVIEYLKGAGEDEIVVRDPSSHTFLTSKEALEEAEHHLAVRRNSTWDDRAAVVFLHQIQVGDSGDGTTDASHVRHGFTTINSLWGEHTIDDLGKAWLPANALTPDGQDVGDFIRSAGNDLELLTDSDPAGGSEDLPLIFTLGELRSRMEAIATLLEEGRDIEGYEECIVQRYITEHWIMSWEAGNGPFDERPIISEQVSSGQPTSTEFYNTALSGGEFSRYWLTGADGELFSVQIVDENGNVIVPDDRYPVLRWYPKTRQLAKRESSS